MKTQATTFLALLILLITTFATAQDNFYSRSKTSFIQPEYSIPGFYPTHKSVELDAPNLLSPILPDFQVNKNAGSACKKNPAITKAPNGSFIVAWLDFRNGAKKNLYAQRYASDGSAVESNFLVNDSAGTLPLSPMISIAIDKNNNFMIAWADERNDKFSWDILAQRYNSEGIALGGNFQVNDDTVERCMHLVPYIIAAGNGNYVIAWMDDRVGSDHIYAQRLANDGTALGSNFKVNDDNGPRGHQSPAIASDEAGNFVIVWTDLRVGTSDIYAQRYSMDGIPVEKNIKVNDDVGFASQTRPYVASVADSNFMIFWQDNRDGEKAFYAQYLAGDGTRMGENFKIDFQLSFYYDVTIDKNRNCVFTWREPGDGGYNAYALGLQPDGTAWGDVFAVNAVPISLYEYDCGYSPPMISSDSSGNCTIVWVYTRNDESQIMGQHYSESGIADGNNFRIDDDDAGSNQTIPAIASAGNGDFIIAWKNGSNWTDIYGQRFSADGRTLGNNFTVNSAGSSSFNHDLSVSADKNGNFVITWDDTRNQNNDIFAQRYSSDGIALGSNFQVNHEPDSVRHYNPEVASDADGNFVITWSDDLDYITNDIYAQRFSNAGEALGSNFKVNDDTGNSRQASPDISSDADGNFVIAWQDSRGPKERAIYAQRYLKAGTALGSNFRVNEADYRAGDVAIASDADGNFVISWIEEQEEKREILAQRYLSDGTALGNNFRVNDQDSYVWDVPHSIAMESGKFIITWTDSRNGDIDIYAQRFSGDGTALGGNFRITGFSTEKQVYPAVQMWQNRIYTTWSDNRAEASGYDIWANILDWENPDEIIPVTPTSSPASFLICQNYPNPFNPETSIVYELPAAGEIKIEVFDIRGRLVNTLINAQISAGIHRVRWNGVNESGQPVASGVYYYRINYTNAQERRTAIKKMTLIR